MTAVPQIWILVPWVVWALSWMAASLWANPTVKRPGGAREIPYRIFTTLGFILLIFVVVRRGGVRSQIFPAFLAQHYWTLPDEAGWAMVALATLGFLFCWWARLHLGRLWSGSITRKEGHRVVDTGPYALVRHPIYTGLLTAGLATMVVRGDLGAIIGFISLTLGYYMKARVEEGFLRQELGASDYDAYAARVPMLVPFT
ncbi:MAG TPA: isoprenylcysteine carboxylmethyltransferase family protein [Rhizomicrobium sp.]|nr:isoprenylcysteine carboxylmethyltransferase family protein [Rhizomicrobium sp.]